MTPPPIQALLQHETFVRELAGRYAPNAELAEDLIQDTWVTALRRPPKGSVRRWLSRVVRNHAIDTWRRERYRTAQSSVVPLDEDSPDAVFERTLLTEELAQALGALDERQRTVIELRFVMGLTPGEVAERLGLSIETVRTRQKRALAKLRARLDRELGPRRAEALLLGVLARITRDVPPARAVAGVSVMAVAVLALAGFGFFAGWRSLGPAKSGEGPSTGAELVRAEAATLETAVVRDPVVRALAPPRTGRTPDVEVIVEDIHGAPVPGAIVRTAPWEVEATAIRQRGRTDERGRLTLARADASGWVWAVSPGGRASRATSLRYASMRSGEVVLRLTERPIEVRGQVLDSAGRGVAGARVDVTFQNSVGVEIGEPLNIGPRPPSCTSDAEGRFRVTVHEPTTFTVYVLASGFAPVLRKIEGARLRATAGDDRVLTVRLSPPASVRGQLLLADGTPAAGGRVSVVHGALRRNARADDDGRFELDGLPRAALELVATHAAGWAATSIDATSGARHVWDARLDQEPQVRGRVVDETGRPLADWTVAMEREPKGRIDELYQEHRPGSTTLTDGDGRFRFERVVPGAARLIGLSPDDRFGAARAEWQGIAAGMDVVLTAAPSTASVRAKLGTVDRSPTDVIVFLSSPLLRRARVAFPDASGELLLTGLPAGNYALVLWAPGCGHRGSPGSPFTLRAGEARDLGRIAFGSVGTLDVRVVRADGGVLGELEAWVFDNGAWVRLDAAAPVRGVATLGADRLRLENFGAGTAELLLLAPGYGSLRASAEVVAGAERAVELSIGPGAPCELIVDRAPDSAWHYVGVRLEAVQHAAPVEGAIEAGYASWDHRTTGLHDRPRWRRELRLPPGEYVLRAIDAWPPFPTIVERAFTVSGSEAHTASIDVYVP
ncbi:MAG: sigma-70 family RNA polymerase sigma factor [bacterium]|nr:sigma-70 family RNA polymerase sigma factor [bacterium]